jgi:hypothetical protein
MRGRATVLLSLTIAALVLVSCGSPSTTTSQSPLLRVTPEPGARPGELAPTLGPQSSNISRQGAVQLGVISGLLSGTPIFSGDFADPYILRTPDALYTFATSTVTTQFAKAANIPVIELTPGSDFTAHYLGDALPKVPKWTVKGFQWAPAVWARPDGTYVMYYSTPATIWLACQGRKLAPGCVKSTHGKSNAECISRATSTQPAGPYVDDSLSAFICPTNLGGAIDPSVFVASDGTPWLLWKGDGDCCHLPTEIYIQQLSSDGLSVVGPPHALLGATQPWEGGLVEGPSMVENNGQFWLFYSANSWGTPNYAIGVARCASITGPCTKPLNGPWLASERGGKGPGGQEFFQVGGLVWMVHHVLAPGESGNNAQRRIHVDLIAFRPGQVPHIAPPVVSAALAELFLYYDDPKLPAAPKAAFVQVMRAVPGMPPVQTRARLLAEGQYVCTGLGHQRSAVAMDTTLEKRGLSAFQGYTLGMFASEYLCPKYSLEALKDLQGLLNTKV